MQARVPDRVAAHRRGLVHRIDAVEQQAAVDHREDDEEEDRSDDHELDQPLAMFPSPSCR
jgi:hypothetical protein